MALLNELLALFYEVRTVVDPRVCYIYHFAWLMISSYMSSGILLAKVMATRMILEALRPGRLRRI